MGILQILLANARAGSRARRPDQPVPYPPGFRGMLTNDPALCVGCKTCAYVCSPGALTFDECGDHAVAWQYYAGQCTFCGRCVEHCPCHALSFAGEPPEVTEDPAAHRVVHEIPYRSCQRCGRPVMPVPLPVHERFMHEGVYDDGIAVRLLCERCRQHVFGQRIKNAWRGSGDSADY